MNRIDLDINNIKLIDENLTLCLGYFDGLHLGHQQVIKKALENTSGPVGILTFEFDEKVAKKINKEKEVLTSLNDRYLKANKFGLDYFITLKVDESIMNYTFEEFINKVLIPLGTKKITCGTDFTFGKGKLGNVNVLKKYFPVNEVALFELNNRKISTKDIIAKIRKGDVKSANEALGYPYQLTGVVVEGFHNGTAIGYPTENLKMSSPYVIPKFGVYKTICYISGVPHVSLTNIGVHPTIQKLDHPSIETFIPNYFGIDYGKTIYLEFVEFIRDEMRFFSVQALREQIKKDLGSIL